METKSALGILGTMAMIALFSFWIIVLFTGLHIVNGEGQHVGYVTATSTHGLFFKTHQAYIKTDTQSSQEDLYCVLDEDVLKQLKELSDTHSHVQVEFIHYFATGISECEGNPDIITSVSVIN